MVIGSVIGVNIFIKPAVMAQALPSAPVLLAIWVLAGVVSLSGALLYAELGAAMPQTGGDYVYLREAFGETLGFLYVWMTILIRATLNVAMFALAIGGFLASIVPLGGAVVDRTIAVGGIQLYLAWRQIAGVAAVVLLAAVNCAGVRAGGVSQSVLTILKLVGAATLIGGAVFFHSSPAAASDAPAKITGSSLGTVLLATLMAYNGWNWIAHAAGEVRDPTRNIPRALATGMAAVIVVYCLLNWTYLYTLGVSQMATSNSSRFPAAPTVGAKAAEAIFGPWGVRALSVLFLVSAMGVTNAFLLSSSRLPYALACDGLFFPYFARLNRRNVPARAILCGVGAGSVLTFFAGYDRITDVLTFSQWIFFTFTALAVIVLRRKAPDLPRPYRSPLYPFLPIAVATFGVALVGLTLWTTPVQSALAVLLILMGIPACLLFRLAKSRQARAQKAASAP
jgi:APA family basic amino acid/polyamine antiporter